MRKAEASRLIPRKLTENLELSMSVVSLMLQERLQNSPKFFEKDKFSIDSIFFLDLTYCRWPIA